MPVAPLGILALEGSKELATLIDRHLTGQRGAYLAKHSRHGLSDGFARESFLINFDCFRFMNGEGKAVIHETVRGHDIYILADVGNYSCKFKMFGMDCPMSPDDHFQDIKRVIAAIGGRARRITVIMPLLYSGRQHKRQSRESLDCAVALQELERLGVDNIFTFDAHDPRVQNAIPLTGFNNLYPTYQIIRALLQNEKDLVIDKSRMVVVSPDEGAMGRSIYYASMLGLNVNLFYKRRDHSRVVNGKNPIVQHEFLGDDISGKDVLIIDDLIASGESILDIARELKRRKANRIYIAVTFALFTEGLEKYHRAFEEGVITRVYDTNLTYRTPELMNAPWFVNVDMSEFIAYLIDMLNYDQSISPLFDPTRKIRELLKKYQG
ncbi:MAG: ribose-phosphate pyrophosphokinase [Firmicutes bacterium]|nr:ribose-phosphate pyrophosphokinase [Bacillota bacterium]